MVYKYSNLFLAHLQEKFVLISSVLFKLYTFSYGINNIWPDKYISFKLYLSILIKYISTEFVKINTLERAAACCPWISTSDFLSYYNKANIITKEGTGSLKTMSFRIFLVNEIFRLYHLSLRNSWFQNITCFFFMII